MPFFLINLLVTCKRLPNNDVLFAFREKFPDAEIVTWENEDDEGWEAHFKISGIEHLVDSSINGKWLGTEKLIDPDEVPKIVLNTFNEKYERSNILKIYKELASTGDVSYEFELRNDSMDIEVEIDTMGNQSK